MACSPPAPTLLPSAPAKPSLPLPPPPRRPSHRDAAAAAASRRGPPPRAARARATAAAAGDDAAAAGAAAPAPEGKRRCLRCGRLYLVADNSPTACAFHGYITGEKGLFALAPPHQGVDGEWSDGSGVIVYRWNDPGRRPNTGRENWKRRWSCCQEREEGAPPCRRGWHVSYDDGFTLF